ncbi:MAG: hypothetical protein M1816_002588 [Peltula sp. TS41687]|nr:MAG: hypothetical protein M1816_002588 [Peltula sp. TS41687]
MRSSILTILSFSLFLTIAIAAPIPQTDEASGITMASLSDSFPVMKTTPDGEVKAYDNPSGS